MTGRDTRQFLSRCEYFLDFTYIDAILYACTYSTSHAEYRHAQRALHFSPQMPMASGYRRLLYYRRARRRVERERRKANIDARARDILDALRRLFRHMPLRLVEPRSTKLLITR